VLTAFGVMSADYFSLLPSEKLVVDCLREMSASSIARWERMAWKEIKGFAYS
jgi:hypothetical protein